MARFSAESIQKFVQGGINRTQKEINVVIVEELNRIAQEAITKAPYNVGDFASQAYSIGEGERRSRFTPLARRIAETVARQRGRDRIRNRKDKLVRRIESRLAGDRIRKGEGDYFILAYTPYLRALINMNVIDRRSGINFQRLQQRIRNRLGGIARR